MRACQLKLTVLIAMLIVCHRFVWAQTAPELNFNHEDVNASWKSVCDPGQKLDISFPQMGGPGSARYLRIDFDNRYTASVQLPLAKVPQSIVPTDFTPFKAVALQTYSLNDDTSIRFMVEDEQGVQYSCRKRVRAGWTNEVVYPFRDMVRFANCPVNKPIDWAHIRLIAIEPSDYSEKGVIGVGGIRFLNEAPPVVKPATPMPIRLNDVGYYPGATKIAVIADEPAGGFQVVAEDGGIALRGTLSDRGTWSQSGEHLWLADFSALTKPGTYHLQVYKTGRVTADSDDFIVGDHPFAALLKASVRAYTLQRCSTELRPDLFGPYARPAAHADTACRLMPSTGHDGKQTADVSGGWYDAGDYGKYVVNAGVTLGTLMFAHQWYPKAVGDDLRIPESGNGISDLADEIAWELRWMSKMQDPADGGVYFKVGSLTWDGFVPPKDTKYERVVMGKSTTSTLNFAAVMAQASTSGIVDHVTSARYLEQARAAWKWALAHPNVAHPSEESGTGPYDDKDYADEFLWASAELALATNDVDLWKDVQVRLAAVPAGPGPQWQNVGAMAYIALATSPRQMPEGIRASARKSLMQICEDYLSAQKQSPYRLPMDAFFWGSTSNQMYIGVLFVAAYQITREQRWLNAAEATVDYVLGCNALDRSFVTGFGSHPPMHIHHRIVLGYRYPAPFPGMLVGGPNPGLDDDVRKDPTGVLYPDLPPARQYMDNRDAAGFNEVCINWNAPLVLVLSALESDAK